MLSSLIAGKRKWLFVVLAVLILLTLITFLLPGKKGNNQKTNSSNNTATATSSSVQAVPTYQLAQTTVQVTPAGGGGAGTASYEAEASGNIISGMGQIVGCSECSGGKRVGYIRSGSKLQFNNINVSTTGTYILTVYYVDGLAQRDAKMSVNDGPQYLLSNFHSTNDNNWNFVQSTTEVVTLSQGSNTITFTNGTYPNCPDIDRITVGSE